MATVSLDAENSLYYEHVAAKGANNVTFVFINALTGTTEHWAPKVTAPLEAAGHGTLVYNFRGQINTTVSADRPFDEAGIVDDLCAILDHCQPQRPVLVGLSIGGLFGARAILRGQAAAGLVFLNTLRKPGTRLDWVNAAVVAATQYGGPALMGDLMTPMILNKEAVEGARANALKGGYQPMDEDAIPIKLLKAGGLSNWDVPYEQLTLPVLSISGLQDQVFYDAGDVADLLKRLPNALSVDFADCGHMIPVERPGPLAHHLLAFANGL